ncbi:hypothetical protein TIFTF001_029551, partial [Ficus carica]
MHELGLQFCLLLRKVNSAAVKINSSRKSLQHRVVVQIYLH